MGALIDHREDHRYYRDVYAKVTFTRDGVDWAEVAKIYARAPLVERTAAETKRAFANSYLVCFAWVDGKIVGAARVTSDGVFYATIIDVAVDPAFQRSGIGRKMMQALLRRLSGMKVYLTTVPGKEGFYEKLGFLRQTNAMGYFPASLRKEAVDRGILVV